MCVMNMKPCKHTLRTYHICSFIFFPCNSTVLILKSIPKETEQKEEFKKDT